MTCFVFQTKDFLIDIQDFVPILDFFRRIETKLNFYTQKIFKTFSFSIVKQSEFELEQKLACVKNGNWEATSFDMED